MNYLMSEKTKNALNNMIASSSLDLTSGRRPRNPSMSRPSSGDYEGPFAVVASDNTTVKIYSYNADEDRSFVSHITAGLQRIDFTESEVTISGSGYVWIEITQADNVYSYECKSGSELPAQTDSLNVVELAEIGFDDGKISEIIQKKYGDIEVTGRIV